MRRVAQEHRIHVAGVGDAALAEGIEHPCRRRILEQRVDDRRRAHGAGAGDTVGPDRAAGRHAAGRGLEARRVVTFEAGLGVEAVNAHPGDLRERRHRPEARRRHLAALLLARADRALAIAFGGGEGLGEEMAADFHDLAKADRAVGDVVLGDADAITERGLVTARQPRDDRSAGARHRAGSWIARIGGAGRVVRGGRRRCDRFRLRLRAGCRLRIRRRPGNGLGRCGRLGGDRRLARRRLICGWPGGGGLVRRRRGGRVRHLRLAGTAAENGVVDRVAELRPQRRRRADEEAERRAGEDGFAVLEHRFRPHGMGVGTGAWHVWRRGLRGRRIDGTHPSRRLGCVPAVR